MPIALRADFDAHQLRSFARKTKDGPQARRLLALGAIYDGASRTEAYALSGVNVSPSSAFSINPEYSPNAVRISLGAEQNIGRLKTGLERIARTLETRPVTNLSLV